MFTVIVECFKPCYKWNTFNTYEAIQNSVDYNSVLNLVINGIPSILRESRHKKFNKVRVLNLVINGIPSILKLLHEIKKGYN